MGKPATLRVDILADSKKATAELDGFSSKVAGFTAGITSAFAGFALDKITDAATASAGFLVDAVQQAGSLSAALGTLNQNYGTSSALVAKWAKTAADSVGLSELAAVNAANKFATYARFLGISGLEAATFSTKLVKTASDLAAFSDLPVEDAINAIGSALRGERDPLERFGILLNDAQVKAAYFRATGEEVNGTLTTQQSIVGTLAALEEQGAAAAGAFARESDQLGTKQQILKAKIEDVSTKIGTALLPIVDEVIKKFAGPLVESIGDVATAFEEGGISGALGKVGEKWSAAAPEIVKGLDNVLASVTGYIQEHPPDFAAWIKAASEWLELVIKGDGTDENPGIVVRVSRLIMALQDAFLANEQETKDAGAQAGETLGAALFDGIWRALGEQATHFFTNPSLWQFITNPKATFVDLGMRVGKDIGEAIVKWIAWAITEWLPEALKSAVTTVLKGIGGFLGGAAGAVYDFFGNAANSVTGNRSQALTINYYTTVNADIPPGISGWDAGANIALALNDYYQRTGYNVPAV